MKSNTNFTIKINPTGYSDQLNQFMLIYEIGIRLGLTYVYTDIAETYRQFNENTPKFIDTLFEDDKVDRESFAEYTVVIDAKEITQHGITSGEALIRLLRAKLEEKKKNEWRDKKKLPLFVLTLNGNREPFFEILSTYDDDITVPLRRAMNEQLLSRIHQDLYPFDGQIKIFIHLRLGDVTRLATPWAVDFNLWHSTDLGALEVSTPESLRLLRVCIRELTEVYGEDKICFSIHSDNVGLAQRDYANLMEKTSTVSEEQRSICRHLLSEMSAELELFKQFKNAHVFIDKDPVGVEKLIAALVSSDLAITNGLQRMITKLIGIFHVDQPMAIACLMEASADKKFHSPFLPTDDIQFIPLAYPHFSLKPLRLFIDQKITQTGTVWHFPNSLAHRNKRSAYSLADVYQAGCELQTANHLEDALSCFERSDELCNANDEPTIKQIDVLEQLGKTDQARALQDKLRRKAEDALIAKQQYVSTKFNMGERAQLKSLVETFGEELLDTEINQKITDILG